ncbi:MAG: hypothetical protein R3257_06330 [bacterium]|nr:hypothetical protein [bacterium]
MEPADSTEVSAADEIDEEHRAILPNSFNPTIHHRRPSHLKTEHFGLGVYSDIDSRYVWHGLLSSEGAVWQPSFTVEYYGVGFNVWANFPLIGGPNQGQFNEVDFTLYYNKEFKKFTFHTWIYTALYPNGNPTSLDFGVASLEWDLHISRPVGPILLFTDLGIRFVSAPGSVFWDVGVGYAKTLPLKFAVETSASFAIANGKFTKAHIAETGGTVPYQFEASLAFPWRPLKGFTVTPKMFISTLLNSTIRAATANPTLIWGGVSLSYELGSLR